MADQLVDGPPAAKRQKIASPTLTPSDSGGGLQQNTANLPQTSNASADVTADESMDALGLRYNKSATTTTQITQQQVPSGMQPVEAQQLKRQERLRQAQMLRRRMAIMTGATSSANTAGNAAAGGLQHNTANLPQTSNASADVTSDAMKRAYDALGLRYNKSATTTTPQITQQQVPSGMQPECLQQQIQPNPKMVPQRPPQQWPPHQQYPQQPPQQQQQPPQRIHMQPNMQRMPIPQQQQAPVMNAGMGAPQQQRPPQSSSITSAAVHQLLHALKNQTPHTHDTEQKVLAMLKQNPVLMASVLRIKEQRMQQQQQQNQQPQQIQNMPN